MLSSTTVTVAVAAALALTVFGGVRAAAVLAARAGVFALWAAALTLKHLATHPRQAAAAAAAAVAGWLIWPYLGGVTDGWLIVLGVAGVATFVTVMAYAVLGQARFGADLRASVITDPAHGGTQLPATHWSEDYR